tara:strand:+ start:195 stop:470 length:276 start_codon:yes stop_codon:yes gene_type:complete
LLVNINVSKLKNNQRGKSMSKTFLIRDIPEVDWKKFKRWTVVQDFNNLNHAITTLIKRAGNNEFENNIPEIEIVNRDEVLNYKEEKNVERT